jgi:hypothetical protein
MSHRPLWISNFTKPSSRIFNRRDWQASSFNDIGAFHYFVDFERLLAERAQDIFSIIQHD